MIANDFIPPDLSRRAKSFAIMKGDGECDFETVGAFLADPTLTFHTGDSMVVDGGYTIF